MDHGAAQVGVSAPRPLGRDERDAWGPFLRTMFHVGVNTFGGPVAQIGVMHEVAVERRRWLSDGQFVHLLNFANVLPGPEALEIAIHLGYLRRGVAGGIAAGLLFIWPGFVSLTAIAWMYDRYGSVPAVTAVFDGIRPVAMALIASAVLRLSLKSLKGLPAYGLMATAFVASFAFGAPFLALLLGCGLLGTRLARLRAPSVERWQRSIALALIAAAIGAGFLAHGAERPRSRSEAAPATARRGPDPGAARQVEIAWVSTKAALLTFGGAYTVLPYLREQMAVHRDWVDDAQVADALALGETTPGPLISFGIFLSYLAGGLAGAVVGCVFLFLPSFVLVLALGRHIEKVEHLPFAAPFLWGVSAGTIGLILSMAAQILPLSVDGPWEAALALAAFVALARFRVNAVAAVAAGGALGLASSLLA